MRSFDSVLLDVQPAAAAGRDESLFVPHYRSPSPLSAVLEKTDPAKDVFPTEVIAHELNQILGIWREGLMRDEPDLQPIAHSLNPQFKGSRFNGAAETIEREGSLRVWKRRFDSALELSASDFVAGLSHYFRDTRILWAEFKITSVESSGRAAKTQIRYDLVDSAAGYHRRQRTGWMELTWTKETNWTVLAWRALTEQFSRSEAPLFEEITHGALGGNASFHNQILRGTDHWRSILDGACGIDIYGNQGIAAGDFDGDGWDDLYICQPSGLPNRLYRNRGDGTFEDVTDRAGVGVIDSSPTALFADLNNDGRQDLLVVTGAGPLFFANQGDGTFRVKKNAFGSASHPEGTFTGAAIADYDRDGWLDIYFCLYSYYQGLSRYRYPVPYYNAQNGPPNFLFRNNRDGTFSDVTHEAGLDRNNNRFSFACGWCDYDGDGWPDLYIANDFGEKNLYHNNGDGTFTDVAETAGVLDTGAGMSVCWFDGDNDGRQDLYVADMWTAAGMRVTALENFLPTAPASVRALYHRHAMGNSLYRNQGASGFKNETEISGTGIGRWAWSSDAWDFDFDGFEDLYIANGMISGPERAELSSFFWRQVVARSPLGSLPTGDYEAGWNAINELIRSDGTWSGYERNVLYLNNRNGTFAEVSGAAGLDCLDDSRSFALADIDHDGRQELILKNRTGPQVRVFRNVIPDLGHRVSFKLKGNKSGPDAIGAILTVWSTAGRHSKVLQAGSGFLAQHSKELFFGLGKSEGTFRAQVRWPSGNVQEFSEVPADHRIEIEEGAKEFKATPFPSGPGDKFTSRPATLLSNETASLPVSFETWLIAPVAAPDFNLPDLSKRMHALSACRGRPALLNFWTSSAPGCLEQLREFKAHFPGETLPLLAINVDDPPDAARLAAIAKREGLQIPLLQGTPETAAVYNLLYRYTFDRRRNLNFPISFLLDSDGNIVKIYQGKITATQVLKDERDIPRTPQERQQKALPFPGTYYAGSFTRNYFSYGVAFAQHGYSEAAEAAFKRAIQQEPQSADAYYDLGTLYMQKEDWEQAEALLQKALALKPDNPTGLNNLGVIAARRGQAQNAERYFKRALELDPTNMLSLGNLADLYRTQGRGQEAEQLLKSALEKQPDNPELTYKLGMVFAGMGRNEQALKYFERTVSLEPDNPEALDNLGVVYVLLGQLDRAVVVFSECIERAPKFDQAYLNLAKVDVRLGKRQQAVEVLRALLKEIPDHPSAKRYLQELDR